ncbi:MAG: hypothetical protein P4L50_00630 [Anaerolineaceae bacterium]|nr:hypothetical protein [Anaerolineaceae bacterium]
MIIKLDTNRNALDFDSRYSMEAPAYRARWSPIFFEPITGSGERITVGIILRDSQGYEVKRTIRDDILKSLYGSKKNHLLQMIETVLESFQFQSDIEKPHLPITGFSIGLWREASSWQERYGVFRQAIYRSSSLASLEDLDIHDDDVGAQEATKQWASRVRDQVVQLRPPLASCFNQDVPLIFDGLPPRIGFLFLKKGANFETLRPNGLPASVRAARGKLYELVKIKNKGELERGALIMGTPHDEDLTYSEKVLKATARAVTELFHEAQEDGLELLTAHSVNEAADHVLRLAA